MNHDSLDSPAGRYPSRDAPSISVGFHTKEKRRDSKQFDSQAIIAARPRFGVHPDLDNSDIEEKASFAIARGGGRRGEGCHNR